MSEGDTEEWNHTFHKDKRQMCIVYHICSTEIKIFLITQSWHIVSLWCGDCDIEESRNYKFFIERG